MADCGVTRVTNCTICLGTYKEPRVLPCGHTFCLDCIKEHGRNKGSDPDCPNCRTHFQIPSDGFAALPKNYCLNLVLNECLSGVDMSRPTVIKRHCEKHSGEELVLYCVQCKVVICLDCLEDDHQKHDCSKIIRFAKTAQTQLDGFVKSIKPILSEVTSQKSLAEEESKKFRYLLDKSELAINEECDNIIQLVNGHKRLLLEELSNENHRITKALKMKTDEIEAECLELTSFITRIEEMLQGTDEAMTFDLVHQYKNFKDSFDKLSRTQLPADMGHVSVVGVNFIPGDFKDFIRRRGNAVGRLQKESDYKPKFERYERLQRNLIPSSEEVPAHIPDAFNAVTCTVQSLDQFNLEEQKKVMELCGVEVILNTDRTFRLKGEWLNVSDAIEQLKELKMNKSTNGSKEQISDHCDATEPKFERGFTRVRKQIDLSLLRKVPIDLQVWYYLSRKHQDKLDRIAQKHLCVMKVVCDSSNEGISHSFEVVPYCQDDSTNAKKRVDDTIEEFTQLYQRTSEAGIVKESIQIPVVVEQSELERLIVDVEEMGVFFLRSDDPCLIGPRTHIEKAKKRLLDLISGRTYSPAQTGSTDNFGQEQVSAADQFPPLIFETPNGLKVCVSKGDLVSQSVDAIVSPADENLRRDCSAARAIATAALESLQRKSKDSVRQYGKLPIIDVMHTSAGNLEPCRIKFVIHTIGCRKPNAMDDEELLQLVKLIVVDCLCYANDVLKIHSIAIPAITGLENFGVDDVPIEIVGRASFEALEMFDIHYVTCKQKSLHEIHFIDNDEATFCSMNRIFQSLQNATHESATDPDVTTEVLDRYVAVCGLQKIETTPDDNCFARAFATAMQRDLQSRLDWRKVREAVRKEQHNNKDYYESTFRAKAKPERQWSLADVITMPTDEFNAFVNSSNAMDEDEEYDLDVSMNAAANALEVQIILVQLSAEKEPIERHFKPRSDVMDRTVFIAYHSLGHHHFDALVRKSRWSF